MDLYIRHKFMDYTDQRSLFQRIKQYVDDAKSIAENSVQLRRNDLQKMLESEDKIYEKEFTKNVISRTEEDIRNRNKILYKNKEENEKADRAFLEQKLIQQHMESCYEIRQALREKERKNTKICQLEQIVENERKKKRNQDLEKYWCDVEKVNMQRYDEFQRNENCLKRSIEAKRKLILDTQLKEQALRREEERQEEMVRALEIEKVAQELREEQRTKLYAPLSPKMMQYRQDLLAMIESNKEARKAEWCALAAEHYDMMMEIQRIEREDNVAARERKRALHKATMEYIAYVKRMRALEESQEKMRHDRIEDLERVDFCTKSSARKDMERKAAVAAQCYAELRRQVCEEYEKRVRQKLEDREVKILQNLFARKEITRDEILEQRRQYRKDLDKQVDELTRLRGLEEEQYKQDLQRVLDDQKFCTQMCEKYMSAGVDYLLPHENWWILACPNKAYVPKAVTDDAIDKNKISENNSCCCVQRNKFQCFF